MDKHKPLVAVDWGTTNRRLFILDMDGQCIGEEADACGVAGLRRADIADEVRRLAERFSGHRLLLAGMIGSSLGWMEVPYIACPAGIGCLVAGMVYAAEMDACIVPGVRSAPDDPADVMRGEEVQLIGATEAGLIPPDCPVCHPGTHAKWAQMRSYAIQHFRTVMTGEVFALLKSASILADALKAPVTQGPSFLKGVATGLEGRALAADLFSVRARVLLEDLLPEEAASWTSGLLIGSDIRFGLDVLSASQPIAVIGDLGLTQLYAAGLRLAGRECFEIDGGRAFIAGSLALARRLPCQM